MLRPLLDVERGELEAYAGEHGLRWVEDDSNEDVSYPRNFLRHKVMPVLQQRFPAYRATLARSARHFAEAAELLDELAALDAESAIQGERLSVAALRRLSSARGKNLLRYFLAARGAPIPDATRLDRNAAPAVRGRRGRADTHHLAGLAAALLPGACLCLACDASCRRFFYRLAGGG